MSFAYLHECFPDPTKTFVYREVAAMVELGMAPTVFSARRPSAEEQGRMDAHYRTGADRKAIRRACLRRCGWGGN